MRELLRKAYSQDPEKSLLNELRRYISDPASPRDANHRSRIHPLWLSIGSIALFVAAVLLYFSFIR